MPANGPLSPTTLHPFIGKGTRLLKTDVLERVCSNLILCNKIRRSGLPSTTTNAIKTAVPEQYVYRRVLNASDTPLISLLLSSRIMRFAALFAITTAAVASVGGVPTATEVDSRDLSLSLNLGGLFGDFDLSNTNHYGAPIPPWAPGHKPGWYYGPHPGNHPQLPCLGGVRFVTYPKGLRLIYLYLQFS